MKLIPLAACLALAACYDDPPPRVPRPPMPATIPGTSLEVDAHVETEMRDVTSHDHVCIGGDCSTVSVSHREPVDVKHATVTYGGKPLTFGQAQVLADPDYRADYDRMTKLADSCRGAAVPKYIGDILGLAGTLLTIDGGGTTGPPNMPILIGGIAALAGGIVSYAVGRFALGGQDCEPATEIYKARRSQWRSADDAEVEDGLANELQRIAKQFNAAHGVSPTAAAP